MLALFDKNIVFQKSLGFNSELLKPTKKHPFQKQIALKTDDKAPVPTSLANRFSNGDIKQISQIQLNKKESIQKASFVQVIGDTSLENYIGRVNSLWIAGGVFFIHVNKMERSIIHPFYGMRKFIMTPQTCAVESGVSCVLICMITLIVGANQMNIWMLQDIKTTLNLQHDCHSGKCQVTNTRSTHIERLETTIKTPEVKHKDNHSFILNSASLHAQEDHRRLAALDISPVSPDQWIEVCNIGLARWGVVNTPAAAPSHPPPESPTETPVETPSTTPARVSSPNSINH
ncbi:hypothetical protein PGT21_028578 [Puccinia graminis f. sp. tritici]|uniref:Uncharacterized protein n=1 Tax=Puccinia graminis f. sp. tritici TaxID=56615 RepID=A0A5B0P3G8_PUCGR|nr:hypothetical protein PGT21_028578 [Puccinia graminis f. sp. tritici]